MAAAIVQQKTNLDNGTPLTVAVSFDSLPAVGNLIVVVVHEEDSALTPPVFSIADNQGNTYVQRFSQTARTTDAGATRLRLEMGHIVAATSAGTFTVTATLGGILAVGARITVYEVSGYDTSTPIAAHSVHGANDTAATTGNVALAAGGIFFAGTLSQADTDYTTDGTLIEDFTSTSGDLRDSVGHRTVASATTYDCTWTAATGNHIEGMLAVKDAGAAGGHPATRRLAMAGHRGYRSPRDCARYI